MSSENSESAIISYDERVGFNDTMVQETLWRCPKCSGEEIRETYKFCPDCGSPIELINRAFKVVKARELKAGDKIKPAELHGTVVTVEAVSFISGDGVRADSIGYVCVHGCSYLNADDDIEIVVQNNSVI